MCVYFRMIPSARRRDQVQPQGRQGRVPERVPVSAPYGMYLQE
jgi:hypothetical protein